MTKIRVEVCLISARGLRRSSSLWKLQWYAVGWIDPNSKYCTKIDTSGSTNPTWRTKFSMLIDDEAESKWQGLALHVEVYSRDSIFLRETLQGTAVVVLKEFLTKYMDTKANQDSNTGVEQVGSFQLRKKKSGKAQGFVDVSIRISDEDYELRNHKEMFSYPGNGESFQLTAGEGNSSISLGTGNQPYSYQPNHMVPSDHAESYPQPQMSSAYSPHPVQHPGSYYPRPPSVGGPSYQPPRTPPPPPPPSHVGYLPTFLPSTGQVPGTYVNIPSSSSAAGQTGGHYSGFGVGAGAGALAAGAVLFGDDFMSGFELPSSLQDDSLTVSIDPPF